MEKAKRIGVVLLAQDDWAERLWQLYCSAYVHIQWSVPCVDSGYYYCSFRVSLKHFGQTLLILRFSLEMKVQFTAFTQCAGDICIFQHINGLKLYKNHVYDQFNIFNGTPVNVEMWSLPILSLLFFADSLTWLGLSKLSIWDHHPTKLLVWAPDEMVLQRDGVGNGAFQELISIKLQAQW